MSEENELIPSKCEHQWDDIEPIECIICGIHKPKEDSTPSKCKFYDTKTDICKHEMWKFSDEPQSCVLWGQKGCSKFEPKEPPDAGSARQTEDIKEGYPPRHSRHSYKPLGQENVPWYNIYEADYKDGDSKKKRKKNAHAASASEKKISDDAAAAVEKKEVKTSVKKIVFSEVATSKKKTICERSPNKKHEFLGDHGLYWCRYCNKKWSKDDENPSDSLTRFRDKALEKFDSTPSKCEFCGRDLILYKDKWICGHGCIKPAVKPKEPTIIISTITEGEKQAYFGTSNFPPKEELKKNQKKDEEND